MIYLFIVILYIIVFFLLVYIVGIVASTQCSTLDDRRRMCLSERGAAKKLRRV